MDAVTGRPGGVAARVAPWLVGPTGEQLQTRHCVRVLCAFRYTLVLAFEIRG